MRHPAQRERERERERFSGLSNLVEEFRRHTSPTRLEANEKVARSWWARRKDV